MTQLVPSTSTPASNQSSAQINWGNEFSAGSAFTVKSLWWYRWSTADAAPTRLIVYDTTDWSRPIDEAVSVDTGAVGWQSQAVPETTLIAGRHYIVAALWGSSTATHISGWSTAPPAIGAGFTLYGARYAQPATVPATNPTSSSAWELAAVSLSSDPAGTGGGGTGATSGDVDTLLSRWLSSDGAVQTHETDGLPWKLWQEVIDGTHGLGALLSNLLGIAAGLSGVNEDVADLMARFGGFVGTTLEAEIAAIKSLLTSEAPGSIRDALADLAPLAGAEGRILALQRDFVPLPGSGWELQEETDFTREIAWAVPADAYVLTVTDYPIVHDEIDVAGVTWLPRLGWWAPLNGTQGRDRRFINFSQNQLDDWPRRLPGVVIRLDAQVEAHLQAWTFTPAS